MKGTDYIQSRRGEVRRLSLGMALIVFCSSALAGHAGQPCGGIAQQNALTVSLRRTAMKVLGAVRDGDVKGFTQRISSKGVGFGVDTAPLSVAEITRQLKSKTGVYCLLFSTACMPAARRESEWGADHVLSQWKISYREWLLRNRGLPVEVDLLDDSELCGGGVIVGPAAKIGVELQFVLEDGRWVLVNTPLGE